MSIDPGGFPTKEHSSAPILLPCTVLLILLVFVVGRNLSLMKELSKCQSIPTVIK